VWKLDATAFEYAGRNLDIPEVHAALVEQMRRNLATVALIGVPLLVVVGAASWLLATISVRPLVDARMREERFVADVAHELRTPLARIGSVAQAARDADATIQAAALRRIAETSLRASDLVGDLLALMRDEAIDERLLEPVDLAMLARAVGDDLVHLRTDVAVTIDVAGDAFVIGEERRLRQLVTNLAENAVRHARTAVRLRVGIEGEHVVVEIADDGTGVPEHLRERVFDRFYRVDGASGGSGLGLAIARFVARRHGGDVGFVAASRVVARIPRFTE
jgi:signal transduction histidine kinase